MIRLLPRRLSTLLRTASTIQSHRSNQFTSSKHLNDKDTSKESETAWSPSNLLEQFKDTFLPSRATPTSDNEYYREKARAKMVSYEQAKNRRVAKPGYNSKQYARLDPNIKIMKDLKINKGKPAARNYLVNGMLQGKANAMQCNWAMQTLCSSSNEARILIKQMNKTNIPINVNTLHVLITHLLYEDNKEAAQQVIDVDFDLYNLKPVHQTHSFLEAADKYKSSGYIKHMEKLLEENPEHGKAKKILFSIFFKHKYLTVTNNIEFFHFLSFQIFSGKHFALEYFNELAANGKATINQYGWAMRYLCKTSHEARAVLQQMEDKNVAVTSRLLNTLMYMLIRENNKEAAEKVMNVEFVKFNVVPDDYTLEILKQSDYFEAKFESKAITNELYQYLKNHGKEMTMEYLDALLSDGKANIFQCSWALTRVCATSKDVRDLIDKMNRHGIAVDIYMLNGLIRTLLLEDKKKEAQEVLDYDFQKYDLFHTMETECNFETENLFSHERVKPDSEALPYPSQKTQKMMKKKLELFRDGKLNLKKEQLIFSNTLNHHERAVIHGLTHKLGLVSRSYGTKTSRILTVGEAEEITGMNTIKYAIDIIQEAEKFAGIGRMHVMRTILREEGTASVVKHLQDLMAQGKANTYHCNWIMNEVFCGILKTGSGPNRSRVSQSEIYKVDDKPVELKEVTSNPQWQTPQSEFEIPSNECRNLMIEMERNNVPVDVATLTILMQQLSSEKKFEEAQLVFDDFEKYGLQPDITTIETLRASVVNEMKRLAGSRLASKGMQYEGKLASMEFLNDLMFKGKANVSIQAKERHANGAL